MSGFDDDCGGASLSGSGSGDFGGCGHASSELLGEAEAEAEHVLGEFETEWHHIVLILGSYFVGVYRLMLLCGFDPKKFRQSMQAKVEGKAKAKWGTENTVVDTSEAGQLEALASIDNPSVTSDTPAIATAVEI